MRKKVPIARCYPETLKAINKDAKKAGSQQEVLKNWHNIKVRCECNK